jgi:Ca2+-binding EF-hand superfamily protein
MKELINALNAGEITLEQFVALMAEMSEAGRCQINAKLV